MTTSKQDEQFIKDILPDTLLELAIAWINKNMEPEDVFGWSQLESWARNSGFVEESR